MAAILVIPTAIAAFFAGAIFAGQGAISEADFLTYAHQRSDKLQQCIDGLTKAVVHIETLKAEGR